MAQVVLDVVAMLPDEQRDQALALSAELDKNMQSTGCESYFRLGEPYAGSGGPCEPHVSIFMLAVAEGEVAEVLCALKEVARTCAVMPAEGLCYRHNPHGAPELYYCKTPEWIDLQRTVIDAVEPLRRGRLRDVDPAGDLLRELMADPQQDTARGHQLAKYGYDEVTPTWSQVGTRDDRFNPHVTLAWPTDPACRVPLADLPSPETFSGALTELGLYGMSPYGTCTEPFGTVPLKQAPPKQAQLTVTRRRSVSFDYVP
jgi:hypothetical protein